ncbi:MAG TPA: hypothetical protein VHG08_27410 [Longimicrobium sp.]|nr:hypothetical protein [Longimicrobium sp.]
MIRIAPVLLLVLTAACFEEPTIGPTCTTQPSQAAGAWQDLSDAELRAEVERACGRVLIGFKEAGASRGVDDLGQSITSPETVIRMKAFVRERGVTIELEYDLIPAIAGWMPARLDLVTTLRQHPNVDRIEPVFPGARWD